ncbi:hypothetical protein M378DRAFT_162444 [Amanita muscaria Koide BX008]|uniref:Uncharacterized protein n=1 Tax=Amanita muscaria (strain Koide BX008) TaxID=946122 RepID=A0A0C2X8U0_AMAMK|nr:hypothetical protein M378DRAFT_162444 [Amanita muscaria Koide BX008]
MKYGLIFDSFVLGFRNFSSATLLNQCRFTLPINLFVAQICLWAGEALLGIRIWALWDRDLRLTFGLPIVHSVLTLVSFANVAMFIKSVSYKESPVPHMTGCFVDNMEGNMRAAAICMLVWITLMLVLLLIPGFRAYRAGRNSHFVRRIFRDGILYYLYLLALHVANLVMMITNPLFLAGVPLLPVLFLHIALTSRIFLHTRQQANRQIVVLNQTNGEEMQWDPTFST